MSGEITATELFCGAGGAGQGLEAVRELFINFAANHWKPAIDTYQLNFPKVTTYQEDIHEAAEDGEIKKWPSADFFWASPECPQWSRSNGKPRDFDKPTGLFRDKPPDPAAWRSRALMWDVTNYLEAMKDRGKPVKVGVVENVIDVRAWVKWDEWVQKIRDMGYETHLVALNSMHASPLATEVAPQSRDRLYLLYWLKSLGRKPDIAKWLSPRAACPGCGERVLATQVFKVPGRDMGRFGQSYHYRSPHIKCRNPIIVPEVLPALAVLDLSIPGQPIGEREKPLKPATMARIEKGVREFAVPLGLDGEIGLPPLIIPVEGREGKSPRPASEPMRTQTARHETVTPPVAEVLARMLLEVLTGEECALAA